MAYHYDTYRGELGKAYPGFGYALWEPNPEESDLPVGVGDVGFIREGRFHRLFNALLPVEHPSHELLGVPVDHDPLLPTMPNHIKSATLPPNSFYSSGVTMVSGGFGILAGPTIGSAEVSFSCKREHGAILSLPVTTRREDTAILGHCRKWIIRHIDSWFAFTQRLGVGIEMEDIILVTGCHRTRSWSNIAFSNVQAEDAGLSLGVEVAGALGANVNWQISNVNIQGAVHNLGPSGENLPETQCIFIRGFRVKRILFGIVPRIKAEGEPNPDPPEDNFEPEKEVVQIPSVTEYRDPLHVLLEYIVKRAPDCDMALVHDDDLERILKGDEASPQTLQPDAMMDYLERSKPEIGVMSDSFPDDESQRTDTEHKMVAMLSEQLKSSGHPSSVSLSSHLSIGTTDREESAQYGAPSYPSKLAPRAAFQDPLSFSGSVVTMDTQRTRRRIPKVTFRVLIIGRANAGKTSILQRVCETTESSIVYRGDKEVVLEPSVGRGEHAIDDELVFSNHRGYVFHDSRGIESGRTEELEILQEFIRRKCGERQLKDRLHAIWYCVPLDNQRPQLDLKFFKDICPDRNVPVIAVFTKYDQFIRNVIIHLEDYPDEYPMGSGVSEVAEKQFQEHYLRLLGDNVRFVRLEKMHIKNSRCDDLIVETAAALNEDVVALMLLAVQRDNIKLSVKNALKRAYSRAGARSGIKHVVRECLIPFPYIWLKGEELFEEEFALQFEALQLEKFGSELSRFAMRVMSLPSIQNLTSTGIRGHHFVLAVVLILKHATFIRIDLSPESALAYAEVEYREANIDLRIQQYLTASSQEHTVELFASFIMDTDIVPPLSSESLSTTHRKDHRFKRIWGQLFSRKSISLPELGNTTGEDK